MISRFWEAFNKPVMARTGQDEFVLSIVGLFAAVALIVLTTGGYLIYLCWRDKKDVSNKASSSSH